MYRKISSFPRKNLAFSLPNGKRIHETLRNLCTAVERLDFGNPNGYQMEDSSHFSGDVNPKPGSSKSVELYGSGFQQSTKNENVVQTQTQSWSLNSWNQNHGVSSQVHSHYKGTTWRNPNSDYQNGGSSSWNSGTSFDCDTYDKILEFDAFCKQDNLKFALKSMEELEKIGYVFDIARLLLLAQICGEGDAFLDVNILQEAIVNVQGKIRASVYHLDENHLRYYTDVVIEQLDAFCKQGRVKKALYTLDTLASMNHVVDLTRLLRLAKLCGEAEALQEAKAVHGKISALNCHLDVSSYHVLIEMYSNCGLVNEASSVFEKMPEKNLETWYSIIRCFAKNGLGEDAIDMFTRFKKEGNKPDGPLFRGIFYACGVLGDVDEGLLHFESMYKDYGIIPTMEHYVSIVEMFALFGFLDEALEFVEKMPMEPNADVWETLMNLSRVHGDLELGDRCAEFVEELDPTRLNKQSREGFIPVKASDVEKESLKKKSGINAVGRGTSKMHEYRAGDTNLPENDELFELLRNIKKHMVEMGYVAETRLALHDIDQESKETALLGHSERIAFARAVLDSAPRKSFTVIKNLRVCVDCHNALKIMADIVGREVIMRDAKRFHHVKNGVCSCKDYW